jgi:fibronectin type 3 domain-containing protein
MKLSSRRLRHRSKVNSIRERLSRAGRRLSVEWLEPRVVLSHDGTQLENFEMPADLAQLMTEAMMAGEAAAATIFPGEQVSYSTQANGLPILNSFASGPADIYLDFDGGTYHGTQDVPAYDTDGNAASYSLSEQLAIYECWRQVSIYFGMFNVNVTTVFTSSRPKAWILPSDSGGSGVSYVNVFANSRPESKAGESTVISRISVIPHEVGHNFGTSHTARYDSLGVKTAEYSSEFDPLHGPIMGIDYSGIIHKWTWWHDSSGDGAYTLQDDMRVITNDLDNFGGDGYRPDDFSGTMNASTTALTAFGVTQSRVGIIERLTDSDAFAFTSTGGRYAIVAGRDAPSGVDLKLSIYNAAGQLLASEDGDPRSVPYSMVNDQHLTLDLPAGTYYAVVESHGNYGDQGQYILRVDPVPTGWSAEDIGLVGVPGYSSFDAATSTYTVTGSGSDIWGAADGFQFLYQTLDGDGSIVARVASLENTNSDAKGGVMIRESLAENSKNAMMEIKPGNTTHFQRRTSTGGSSSSTTGPSGSTWRWMRLTRVGNTITAAVSTNGASWTNVGSQTVTMGTKVLIGLATTSHNNVKPAAATFTDVALTGNLNAGPVLNTSPTTSSLTVSATTSSSVSLSWTGVAVFGDANGDGAVNAADLAIVKTNFGSTGAVGSPGDVNNDGLVDLSDYNLVKNNMNGSSVGYAVERSADGINFTQIGTTAGGVTTYTATGLSDGLRYFFRVRTLGSGNSVSQPSGVVSTVTKGGAVSGLSSMSINTSTLVIDWRDASGESNYRVQRSDDGVNNWTTRSTLARNTPSYTDSGSTGTTYFYRIQTLDSGGNVVATSSVISESTRLATVGGMAFTNQVSNQLAFKWNAVTGATGYRVERSLDNSSFSILTSNTTATTYADNSVSPGTTYYYRVTAIKSGLTESAAPSAVISATPPGAASASTAPRATGSAASSPRGGSSTTLESPSKSKNRTAGVPEEAKSAVQSTLRKFQKETHATKLSSRQRAAVDRVLADWNFERSERSLSNALVKALSKAAPSRPGISLLRM